ncbi:hypothetical protein ACQ4WX_49070 [Streptomyces lasalocidi]
MIAAEDLPHLAYGVANEDVTVGRIGPPQPGQGVGQETQQYGSGDQAVDEGDPGPRR